MEPSERANHDDAGWLVSPRCGDHGVDIAKIAISIIGIEAISGRTAR
jgi:hypothetical protein